MLPQSVIFHFQVTDLVEELGAAPTGIEIHLSNLRGTVVVILTDAHQWAAEADLMTLGSFKVLFSDVSHTANIMACWIHIIT